MTVKICRSTAGQIQDTIGQYPAESGGVIAYDPNNNVIVDFFFDSDAGIGQESYIPTQSAINKQVNDLWYPLGYKFGGVVHSHPKGSRCEPSPNDLRMAERIVRCNCLSGKVFLIIVQGKELHVWQVMLNQGSGSYTQPCKLEIVYNV